MAEEDPNSIDFSNFDGNDVDFSLTDFACDEQRAPRKPPRPFVLCDGNEEQMDIVKAVVDGKDVMVNAVPGAGKTTTVLLVARECPEKTIIQLTYNKALKSEVREKADYLKMGNLDIHTFHSLAVFYYDRSAHSNDGFKNIVDIDLKPRRNIPKVDLLVIDECQDMTNIFFKFVKKFIRDLPNATQMMVVGDPLHCVYRFNGADPRYLTMASNIWERNCVSMPMTISYRLTDKIAKFVNNAIIGHDLIKTVKKSNMRVGFKIVDSYKGLDAIVAEIEDLVRTKKLIGPGDIFIAAAKSNTIGVSKTPLALLESKLSSRGYLCYHAETEGMGVVDEDLMRGKICIVNFHQMKGRERKLVIIMGFDNSYFEYFGKNIPSEVCPEVLFVAATRASERVTFVVSPTKPPLPFLKMTYEELEKSDFTTVISATAKLTSKKVASAPLPDIDGRKTKICVYNLVKHLRMDVYERLRMIVGKLFVKVSDASGLPVKFTPKIESSEGIFEDVSDLNNLAVMSYFHSRMLSSNAKKGELIDSFISREVISKKGNIIKYLNRLKGNNIDDLLSSLDRPCNSIRDHLMYSALYTSNRTGYIGRLARLGDFNWLDDNELEKCLKILRENIDIDVKSMSFGDMLGSPEINTYIANLIGREFGVVVSCPREDRGISSSTTSLDNIGSMDIFSEIDISDTANNMFYEICGRSDTPIEVFLRVACNEFLWRHDPRNKGKDHAFALLNSYTGESYVLGDNFEMIDKLFVEIFRERYIPKADISDDEFVKMCIS